MNILNNSRVLNFLVGFAALMVIINNVPTHLLIPMVMVMLIVFVMCYNTNTPTTILSMFPIQKTKDDSSKENEEESDEEEDCDEEDTDEKDTNDEDEDTDEKAANE